MTINIRQVSSPAETKTFDTRQMRENYLVQSLFIGGQITMTYSHLDRTVIGGATPTDAALSLVSHKQIGSPGFLTVARLELSTLVAMARSRQMENPMIWCALIVSICQWERRM